MQQRTNVRHLFLGGSFSHVERYSPSSIHGLLSRQTQQDNVCRCCHRTGGCLNLQDSRLGGLAKRSSVHATDMKQQQAVHFVETVQRSEQQASTSY